MKVTSADKTDNTNSFSSSFVRDTTSRAVSNVDSAARAKYNKQKEILKNQKNSNQNLQLQIDSLQNQLDSLRKEFDVHRQLT